MAEQMSVDEDGDGVATTEGDCRDDLPQVYPDAPEICDGLDNDCDTVVDDLQKPVTEAPPTQRTSEHVAVVPAAVTTENSVIASVRLFPTRPAETKVMMIVTAL